MLTGVHNAKVSGISAQRVHVVGHCLVKVGHLHRVERGDKRGFLEANRKTVGALQRDGHLKASRRTASLKEMTELKVTPVPVPKYELPQSKHEAAERLSTRICLLGPTQSGKSQLAVFLALTVYKGCWSAVHLWSPNCYKDPTFAPLKKHMKEDLELDLDEHLHPVYSEAALREAMDRAAAVADYTKEEHGAKGPHFNTLFIFDDSMNDGSLRHSRAVSDTFVMGRHDFLSVLWLCHSWRAALGCPVPGPCQLHESCAALEWRWRTATGDILPGPPEG